MSDWANRRKSIYLGIIVLILTSVSFAIFWKYWYITPTCFDSYKNGSESGIDCGGSCTLVCTDSTLKPIIRWDPRLFEVLPNSWSVIVYVENPNLNADAVYVPYTFTIYDENNKILEERKGATILPKNKTVGIFEGGIIIKDGEKPRRAIFELGSGIVWKKNEKIKDEMSITHSPILRIETAPRVEANVKNNDIEEIKNIELVVAIFDGRDNVVATSRTFIETLKRNEDANILFTWPRPFSLGSRVCEKPSNIMLLLDRSGSMSSIQVQPPEPLGEAKKAALSFIKRLGINNKIGLISFATDVKKPIDASLTSDFQSVEQAIGLIDILKTSIQYTNIYEAIHSAQQELISLGETEIVSKIVILLTDGVATNPKSPNGTTEADDIKYAENLALKQALEAKKDGLIIYTIGLGDKINESFLKQIASTPEQYFFAPTANNLETIYKDISTDICKEIPARVEITYKIFGDTI